MKKFFCAAALCGLCAYAPAHAADVRMDDVVISANKIETSASEVTSSVTVITEEDMDALQNRTFVEALNTAPGVFMGSMQGPAGLNTIKIRGSHQRYTQLRWNGVPLREAGTIEGNFDSFYGVLNMVPGSVERIEVLKGAQSTLYGSSAMGGVVSIYSGSKWDSGFNASLDLSGGSYGSRRNRVYFSSGKQIQVLFSICLNRCILMLCFIRFILPIGSLLRCELLQGSILCHYGKTPTIQPSLILLS